MPLSWPGWKALRAAAAAKGLLAYQKQVVVFKAGAGTGTDRLYSLQIPGKSASQVRSSLDKAGLSFRTLVDSKNGVTIHAIGGQDLASKMRDVAKQYGQNKIQVRKGKVEFIGHETSRLQANQVIKKIISDYHAQHQAARASAGGGDRRDGLHLLVEGGC